MKLSQFSTLLCAFMIGWLVAPLITHSGPVHWGAVGWVALCVVIFSFVWYLEDNR